MSQWVTHVSSAITLLSILLAISSFAPRVIKYFNRRRYIRGILISKNPLSLSFPIHEMVASVSLAHEYDVLVLNDVIGIKKIINFCNEINKKVYLSVEDNRPLELDEFHIGGPMGNSRTNAIFREHFENRFLITVPEKHEETYRVGKRDTTQVNYSNSESTFYTFGRSDNGRQKYHHEVKKDSCDLIFYIRIVTGNKAEHILFCNFGDNSQKAVDYLTVNTKMLYEMLSNAGCKKGNCFIIIPIDTSARKVDTRAYSSKPIDLTDIMFR